MKKIQIQCLIAVMALLFVACDKEKVYITYEDGPMAGVAHMGYRGEGYDVTGSGYSGGNSTQQTSIAATSWFHDSGSYGYEVLYFTTSNRGAYYDSWYGTTDEFSYSFAVGTGTINFDDGGSYTYNISGNNLYFRGVTFTRQ